MTQKVGIFEDCTNEDYHAHPAISRSGMMLFAQSPYLYWANYLNPLRPKKESTKAMDFGSAFHTYILEAHLFEKAYVIEPPKVLLKDVGRELYDKYKQECEDLAKRNALILMPDEWVMLSKMKEALMQNSEAWELIQGAKYEQSYFWQDKESGLMVKARPDILHPNMIVDLKTCVSASSRAYQRAMVDGGYHMQAAIIRESINVLEGRDIPNCINLCVEKTYPYQVGIKVISESALEIGRKQFKDILMRMKECFETNIWPSYEIEQVELPGWAL